MKSIQRLTVLFVCLGVAFSFNAFGTSAFAESKPIVFKFACDNPEPTPYSQGQDWFLKEVEKRSEGRIKFQRFWSGSLAPSSALMDGVSTGVVDIAALVSGYWPAKVPLSTVCTMPGLNWDLWVGLRAGQDFFRLPALEEEWNRLNLKVVSVISTSNYQILSTEPIQGLSDFKGKKIRCMGLQAELMKALGGVPVGIVAPEIFDALDRGTIDGVAAPPSFVTAFAFHQAAKNYSNLGLGTGGAWPLAMNLKKWNSLPPDLQQVFMDVNQEMADAFTRIYQEEGDGKSLEKMKKEGVAFVNAPESDLDKITEAARANVWSKWASEREKEGLPGNEILNQWVDLCKKYKEERK